MTAMVLAECIPCIKADASCRAGRPSGDHMTFFPPELSFARDAGRNISQCSASAQSSPYRWVLALAQHNGHTKDIGPSADVAKGAAFTPGLRKLEFRLLPFNFYP